MATKQVTLPDIGVVSLYKRRGNRSLRLSVAAGGHIRVSLPSWVPYRVGVEFALSKKDWILRQRPAASAALLHGQAIGKAHRLEFVAQPGPLQIATRLSPNMITVNHAEHDSPETTHVQKAAHAACIRALRKEAHALLPQRLEQLAVKTGLSYAEVKVKHLKSRWGSCSARGVITLNLFLMQLPWHLIDYVLLHELAHTKVMRHGPPFWEELERHAPRAKELRKEIRQFQPLFGG